MGLAALRDDLQEVMENQLQEDTKNLNLVGLNRSWRSSPQKSDLTAGLAALRDDLTGHEGCL